MPFIMFIVMIIARRVTWLSRLVIWIILGFFPSEIFAILVLDRDLWPKSLLTPKVHAQGDLKTITSMLPVLIFGDIRMSFGQEIGFTPIWFSTPLIGAKSFIVRKSTLVSLHNRENLSPFTKDFRGEEHYNESIN